MIVLIFHINLIDLLPIVIFSNFILSTDCCQKMVVNEEDSFLDKLFKPETKTSTQVSS